MAKNLLTDAVLRALQPSDKVQRHSDGDGLSLIVKPNGSKLWRFRFHFDGVERNMSLGVYPTVSLAKARKKRDAKNVELDTGKNPSDAKKVKIAGQAHTFATVGQEWLDKVSDEVAPVTMKHRIYRFTTYMLPALGNRPIASITSNDILDLLKAMERKGEKQPKKLIDTIHNVKNELARIFSYALITNRVPFNPVLGLGEALKKKKSKTEHHAAVLVPQSFGKLLCDLDNYNGQRHTKILARLSPHVMLRPSELRCAPWSEIDFERAEWRVSKERMKRNRVHVIPLSRQALALLRELHEITGESRLMFPSEQNPAQSLSYATLNKGLKRLGYAGKQTGHGFRSCASTLLNELEFDADAIELQLAHMPGGVRGAYWRSVTPPKLDLRRKMMQKWSDEIDRLKASVKHQPPKLRLVA